MTKVAVLGTGIMGTGMARSLKRSGFEVSVWNRSPEKAEQVGSGTQAADSPSEAVTNADLIFTMLSDVNAVEDVAKQFLDAVQPGAVWCQSSTIGLEGITRLSELAARYDVKYVECPVAGTKQPAEDGKLTVLAAGPDDVRDQVQPALDAIGSKVHWFGDNPLKAGAAKLMINNYLTTLVAGLAETIAFAEAFGIEPKTFLELIEGGPLNSPFAQMKGLMMAGKEYPTSFPLAHAAKDARLVAEAASTRGQVLPVNAGAARLYQQAAEEWGHCDIAAVIRGLGSVSDIP